jgi:hypothetical protein
MIKSDSEEIEINPRNLDKLIKISIERAISAVDSACYEGLKEEIRESIEQKIDNLMNLLKVEIKRQIDRTINKITENDEIKDLRDKIKLITINIYYKFCFLNYFVNIDDWNDHEVKIDDITYSIPYCTKISISYFAYNYFKKIINTYEKNLNEIISKNVEDLKNQILSFQMDFNLGHNNLVDIPWTSSELEIILKDYIYQNISNKIKIAAIKNSIRYITVPLIEQFGKYFKALYLKGMTQPEFEKKANEIIKIAFQKIEEKIKEYNELKNQSLPAAPEKKKEKEEKEEEKDKEEKEKNKKNEKDNEKEKEPNDNIENVDDKKEKKEGENNKK